jgi:hypothetical protein
MNKNAISAFLCAVLACSASIVSAEQVSTSFVPNSGAYIGLGFGANSTQFNGQQLEATGISTVTNTSTGAPVSAGTAGGPPVGIGMDAVNSISPTIQAGYFQKLQDSSYLWGFKFAYSYMGGATSTNNYIRVPQYGAYENGTPFTGNAIASSYQKTIQNQISLIPYFGQSFERGTIYFGVGPTLSQVNTKINNLVGFADLNGVRTDISGVAQNFSSTDWVYGGAAMLGGTYFIDRTWFLDFTYTYAMTQNKTSNYFSTFYNPSSPNTYSGSLIGSSTGTATTQTIGLTLNKLF